MSDIIRNDCQGEGPEFVERTAAAEIASLQARLEEAREIIGGLLTEVSDMETKLVGWTKDVLKEIGNPDLKLTINVGDPPPLSPAPAPSSTRRSPMDNKTIGQIAYEVMRERYPGLPPWGTDHIVCEDYEAAASAVWNEAVETCADVITEVEKELAALTTHKKRVERWASRKKPARW